MSNTDRELQGLCKEVDRLTAALDEAHGLIHDLTEDKDEAWRLTQYLVHKEGGKVLVDLGEMRQFHLVKHSLRFTQVPSGLMTLTLASQS